MANYSANRFRPVPIWRLVLLLGAGLLSRTQAAEVPADGGPYVLVELEGTVEFMPSKEDRWFKAYTNLVLNPGDQIRTLDSSRAVIRWSDLTLERMDQRSHTIIPADKKEGALIEFFRGIIYFFHRDQPGKFDIRTPRASAVVRGTEFMLQVDDDGTTLLTLFDGKVEMTNQLGSLRLESGQEGIARPDQPPERTAGIAVINKLQWCLYYPGILDLGELDLAPEAQTALRDSLDAYRKGDLPQALQRYPSGRPPVSAAEKVYRAAVLLTVGRVEQARALLEALPDESQSNSRNKRLANALGQLIAAVTTQPFQREQAPILATEWMAESYYLQSQSKLEEARAAAREAQRVSPACGFALVRLAELEFSFGRTRAAQSLLSSSRAVSPRNAQALALQGFLFSAQNRITKAMDCYDEAIEVDGALGNAWLGRGLCLIRQGHTKAGLEDVQVAATLEPQRALLRSYLGKTYSTRWDNRRALQEIDLAKKLDPNDPTAWLYSSLVKQQQNRVNESVADLEESQALNDNRSVYRSRLLLDQDRAVRSANLANVYADAGMDEVSVREAARGVNADYANFSVHLFLANSYSRLQDPGRINLRYETAAVSEYLLANLLAPVGAGALSPTISQQEYSKLLEGDGLGVVSATEYLSRGAWSQEGALYGTLHNSSFAFSELYLNDNGQRPNNDLELTSLSFLLKQQITPSDQAFGQVIWTESEGGDLTPYYDPDATFANGGPNRLLRVEESQEPIVLAGYQHAWSPGNHTLFLASRLDDTLEVEDPQQRTLILDKTTGPVTAARSITIGQDYESELEIYSAEAQHIFQAGPHTVIAGGRLQGGEFESYNRHTPNAGSFFPASFFTNLVRDFDSDFGRASLYAYYQVQIIDPLLLVGGVSYDWLKYPVNHRFAPLTDQEETTDQVSPKAGLIWTPDPHTAIRGGYSRGLGGVSFDQSFRIEPSQVAGINQAFRSVMPDAVTGANTAEQYDVLGVALDQAFSSRTYLGLAAQRLSSEVDRPVGVYDALPPDFGTFPLPPFVVPSETRQSLDFEERSVTITLNQLVSRDFSFGAAYRLSYAELDVRFKDIPPTATRFNGFSPRQDLEAYLHQVQLFGIYSHPCGFFGKVEALWFQQSNQGYDPDIPGDEFWQFNIYAGYRFLKRKGEITLGILNLADEDYRLNPLNLSASLPRERTFAARFRFNF
jgi:tetratricopeptide (TPR) repeat protein